MERKWNIDREDVLIANSNLKWHNSRIRAAAFELN